MEEIQEKEVVETPQEEVIVDETPTTKEAVEPVEEVEEATDDTKEVEEVEEQEDELDIDESEIYREVEEEVKGDVDINPDDEKLISAVVDRKMNEFKKQTAREREVTDFLRDNPEFKKYAKAIEKQATDKRNSHLKINFIANGLAARELIKIGADRVREDAEQLKETGLNAGRSQRPKESTPTDYLSMAKEDFDKVYQSVMAKR